MDKTIIFLAGFGIPLLLAKSKFIWGEKIWKNYNCVFFSSKTPRSEESVKKELYRLEKIINSYDNPIIAGHSLGAWWIANLVLHTNVKIQKAIYLTPLADLNKYPRIFYSPFKFDIFKHPVPYKSQGPHKNLIIYGQHDLITPPDHGLRLIDHFNGLGYNLQGGHLLQINHINSLIFMKNWLDLT